MKPILFSTPMVKAILDGRKTQTRRVVKINGQPISSPEERLELTEDGLIYHSVNSMSGYYKLSYQPSDILWVRETWRATGVISEPYAYKADEEVLNLLGESGQILSIRYAWRPSIFMPRAAARIFLRVTDVRAERLQDITEEDARAEGCSTKILNDGWKNIGTLTARDEFITLWEHLNAKRGLGWDTNPWVWVISFERCEKPDDFCSYGAKMEDKPCG
jgi:hypothetical protein